MTETPDTGSDATDSDDLRRHPEDPAEGADPDATDADVPREHPEGPSEG